MVMSCLLNRRRLTSTISLSGRLLREAVWDWELLPLLLCFELMGESEREGRAAVSCFSQHWLQGQLGIW